MKKIIFIVLLGVFTLVAYSCSEATLEEDARRAAELTSLSNQYSLDNNMSSAGKAYEESQEIMKKYKKLDKFDEFYEVYISYLQEGAAVLDEQMSTDAPEGIQPPESLK